MLGPVVQFFMVGTCSNCLFHPYIQVGCLNQDDDDNFCFLNGVLSEVDT